MAIKAVLFDFGGVLTPSPFSALRAWHTEHGLDPEAGLRTLFGPYDQDTDHPWHRLERGEVSVADAMTRIKAAAADQGLDLDPLEMLRAEHDEGPAGRQVVVADGAVVVPRADKLS